MARKDATAAPVSRKPADSDFYQQRLKAWQPILTPKWVIVTFLAVGIPFIILGFVIKAASDGVVEYTAQYDGAGTPLSHELCRVPSMPGSSRQCTIDIEITQTMKAPVYVYYELDNFYQNHRRYVKSRSDLQLSGQMILDPSQLTDCDPLKQTPSGLILDPCGLIANSMFNDTIVLTTPSVFMAETGIAWASDKQKFAPTLQYFGQQVPGYPAGTKYQNLVQFLNQTYPNVYGSDFDVTNEHFIVWMRPAALPNFRKVYGRIDTTLQAGTRLSFRVDSRFPVASFDGKKSIVVSTLSWMGGKNPFLGIAYLAVGFACVAMAAVFGAKQLFGGGRKLGDPSYLVYTSSRR